MRNSGSPVKPCVWIWINPINLLNQLNHPKGVCFYINKFLRNDWADWAEILIFNHRLSGLNRFSLMGKPLLGLILITRIRASHGSCNHPDGLSPRKRKSAESVIIGINKSVKSAKSVVLLLASVFCLRQTQVFTSKPETIQKWRKNALVHNFVVHKLVYQCFYLSFCCGI